MFLKQLLARLILKEVLKENKITYRCQSLADRISYTWNTVLLFLSLIILPPCCHERPLWALKFCHFLGFKYGFSIHYWHQEAKYSTFPLLFISCTSYSLWENIECLAVQIRLSQGCKLTDPTSTLTYVISYFELQCGYTVKKSTKRQEGKILSGSRLAVSGDITYYYVHRK